jgi:alpha-1,6-mannosyltransferase
LLVDSFFWGRFIWPELSQVIWNVVEGRSAEYGTLPFHTYAFVFLPKILLLAYPLIIYAMATSRIATKVALPVLGQVLLMSCLRHKEWRFCCYVIPSLTLVAMKGLSDM